MREPEKNFPVQQAHLPKEVNIKGGVCAGDIQEKVNLSQSSVSHYLSLMQKAGLLEAVRHGQWTYYRRNEETLAKISKFINEEI
ncbi:metalloregulator ArsR/SmtB family transcription factor [Planococcus sp. ISL-109]|uniref:ArsR/SmtB family transcription factor n=1 Tax=Planococcus sp. ISL-109 TaxID=2819166 RepID=UPI0020358C09|nr:metalloregulator ArsR/SmtB family transcription factor [Planococcus sp. ISL-109]